MFKNNKNKLSSWLAVASVAVTAAGCVNQRPSRNGVFNENQYVRKDFLIRPGATDASGMNPSDPGWFMNVTVTSTSTPNPLANVSGAGLFAGSQSAGFGGANRVRFAVTQDKLQLLDMREISNDPTVASQNLRTPAIMNAWPATNVDIRYRVNLDGEITNFIEENQELDWQVRQWVKLSFAKNDMSDLAPFFADLNPVLMNCTNPSEASAALIPNTFVVDSDNGYMEFGVGVTLPISYSDANAATCVEAFGEANIRNFFQLGRTTVTVNLLYSFVRPDKYPNGQLDGSYVPMPLAEKDPIQHKYGAITTFSPVRDFSTTLLGATQYVNRFDPNKDIVYYLAEGMPDVYRQYFVQAGGVVDQTNMVLAKAGAKGRLKVLNFDDDQTFGDKMAKTPKHFGDVRYNFIVWHTDLDNGSALLGVEQQFPDYMTGQTLTASVNVFEGPFLDSVQQRLDLFLQTVGAEYLTPTGDFDDTKYPSSCNDGDTVPLVPGDIAAKLNAGSTVYGKMQAYLQQPVAQYGNLGPANFLPKHDTDFYNAYFGVVPYHVYQDPASNPFVAPEGSVFSTAMQDNWQSLKKLADFDQFAAKIDHGEQPWDVNDANGGLPGAIAFNHKLHQGTLDVNEYQHVRARMPQMRTADDLALFSYFDIYKKNGRHCVGGKWESRKDYTDHLITSLNQAVALHEFGHALGLDHNFMGSVDQRNFPVDSKGNIALYSSSIMDYNQAISEGFFTQSSAGSQWPPYDAATLAWIYGNNLDAQHAVDPNHARDPAAEISGQTNATTPWNDPLGWNGSTERPFLFCSNRHTAYTPLCRPYDLGATPSEIISNEIQQREWNYQWTNFRLYHKYFSLSSYGTTVATQFAEYRRFISLWDFDWAPGELTNTLRLIGVNPPDGATAGEYFTQLTNKFNEDASIANQLGASYHRAIIDQASGERPYITVFDPFYGDTTQQGIQLDKLISIDSFASLWPAISNYDPSQAGALMKSSAIGEDAPYNNLAEGVLLDFLGAAFATYTYAQIGPLAAFAEETHSSLWPGDLNMQDWIGGKQFTRERDFLDYVHAIAVKNEFQNCDENGLNCDPCTSLDHCTWDPRQPQAKSAELTQSDRYNRFQGPDGRTYIWMYMATRNMWVLADKDRNVALYTLMLGWSTDVVNSEDDGYSGAADLELKIRYALDSYIYYNNFQPATP